MIARKLQEVNGTYLISLPRKWAVKLGLRKGAVLTLRERQDGSLIVSAMPEGLREEETEATVVFPMKGLNTTDAVIGLYLLGYDKVDIRWRTRGVPSSDRERVRGLTRILAGVEVIGESEDMISLRCVLDPSSMKPKMILRRMGFLAGRMIQDLSSAAGDAKLLGSVASSDDDLDRAYFLLVRLLRSALRRPQLVEGFELEPTDYLDYRVAAELIEFMGDKASNLALAAMGDTVIAKTLVRLSQDLSFLGPNVVGSSAESFITKDLAKADEARRSMDSLSKRIGIAERYIQRKAHAERQSLNVTTVFFDSVLESCRDLLDLIGPVDIVARAR